jgi:hypothetical protein
MLGIAKSAYPSIQWSIPNRVAMLTPCRPHTLLYVAPAGQPTQSSHLLAAGAYIGRAAGRAVASSVCPTRCMGSMEAMHARTHASPLPVEPRWRTFMPSTSSLLSRQRRRRRRPRRVTVSGVERSVGLPLLLVRMHYSRQRSAVVVTNFSSSKHSERASNRETTRNLCARRDRAPCLKCAPP